MLKKTSSFIFSLSILLLTSCSELLYLSVEQMLPPEVMPEHTARSVGIVSNFSENNVMVVNDDVIILPCNADAVKEHVAQIFVNSCIMDRVVVLDSLPYHSDNSSSHVLSQSEVNTLCHELDVEIIYSIDYACLIYNPASHSTPHPLKAYLCSRIYAPDRDSVPGFSVMDKETLDYWVDDMNEIRDLLPKMPSLLAQSAIVPYLPSWKERERVYYYDRLSYELREAKVFIHEDNWEAAALQWSSLAKSKLRPYRFMGHYNLALYHEMNDDIDAALASLTDAEKQAIKRNKRGKKTGVAIDTSLLNQYREVLQTRLTELQKLEQYQDQQKKH